MSEKHFDTIIVGAGTAGCLLANRLSADPNHRVLLIEAGGKDDYIWIHIPVGYLYCIDNPRTDWRFRTEAEPGLNGRTLLYPRGKVQGGCSSINGMIYMRGQSRDYDEWAALGNKGWGWTDMLPHFMRHEDYHRGADAVHGAGGEWRIEKQRLSWEILDAFSAAAQQTGIPANDDFNRGYNEGVGYFEVNQRSGVRWNSSKAFLRNVSHRKNLTVMTGAQVEHLIVENAIENTVKNKTVIGVVLRFAGQQRNSGMIGSNGKPVMVTVGGRNETIFANETILCAGAVGSPQLLELSGIGDPAILQAAGVEVKHACRALVTTCKITCNYVWLLK